MNPRKILGFLIFWFAVLSLMGFSYVQLLTRSGIGIFMAGMMAAISVMIYGLSLMCGGKLSPSLDFWREKVGMGHPLWFGAIFEFYLDVIAIVIFCLYALVFHAPLLVQKLFVLLSGTTVICVLLYFRLKDRKKLE